MLYPRVCLASASDCTGRLVQAGPCQSVVRWDNGNETVVVNDWIKEIKENGGVAVAMVAPATLPVKRRPPPDDLADRLKDCEPRRLEQFARANDVWDDKYGALPNPGLVRMSVINRLRARVKKGYVVEWPR